MIKANQAWWQGITYLEKLRSSFLTCGIQTQVYLQTRYHMSEISRRLFININRNTAETIPYLMSNIMSEAEGGANVKEKKC